MSLSRRAHPLVARQILQPHPGHCEHHLGVRNRLLPPQYQILLLQEGLPLGHFPRPLVLEFLSLSRAKRNDSLFVLLLECPRLTLQCQCCDEMNPHPSLLQHERYWFLDPGHGQYELAHHKHSICPFPPGVIRHTPRTVFAGHKKGKQRTSLQFLRCRVAWRLYESKSACRRIDITGRADLRVLPKRCLHRGGRLRQVQRGICGASRKDRRDEPPEHSPA